MRKAWGEFWSRIASINSIWYRFRATRAGRHRNYAKQDRLAKRAEKAIRS